MDYVKQLLQRMIELAREIVSQSEPETEDRWVHDAIQAHKRQSLELAVKARWITAGIIAILLPCINPTLPVLYYEILLALFALLGWAHRKLSQSGHPRVELILMCCDLALLTLAIVAPNPFHDTDWPVAMRYRFENFSYFFVLLAAATLSYSWRSVIAMGLVTTGLWILGMAAVALYSTGNPALSVSAESAFGADPTLMHILDPNNLRLSVRVQEIVLLLIVAGLLGLSVYRSQHLLIRHAASERERANLARYFSPNVVDELSHNDEPLRNVRSQEVAVLFVDLVGFTEFAATRDPEQVIATLREFHARMEHEVFRYDGTLDKYLGDGLMATFGTPMPSPADASNAINCARAMIDSIETWNAERAASGMAKIHASFGLHFGPVVLGDIGAKRLEFAVIGNTVNIASRLETLTRKFDAVLVASDTFVDHARDQATARQSALDGLERLSDQDIQGLPDPLPVWRLARSAASATD